MFEMFICQRCGGECGFSGSVKLVGEVYANLCNSCATGWHDHVNSTPEWVAVKKVEIQIQTLQSLAVSGQSPSKDAWRDAYEQRDRAMEGVRKVALEYVKRK